MSKLYRHFNSEKEVLGEVFELPKLPKKIEPLKGDEILDERASFIFKSITDK